MDSKVLTKISSIIDKGEPVKISFRHADPARFMLINSILVRYLGRRDILYIFNSLVTIVREVVVNAIKANAKRVFFQKNDLDIDNPDDYNKGMDRFKEEVIGDFDRIEEDLANSDLYVKMLFHIVKGNFVMKVVNNVGITAEELKRINFRFEKAIKYNDFSEVYDDIEDDTEGAGLGIVLTVLFLKNMGVNPKNFKLESSGGITTCSLVIPENMRDSNIVTEIKEKIVNEVDDLPTFPDSVHELEDMCKNPDTTIDNISQKIELDPVLAVDVLKLSNSAGFITSKSIDSIPEAVKIIGLRNVLAILLASNARRILDDKYKAYEEIWNHCNRAASYSRSLAIWLKEEKSVIENSFMGGLLHDLGKIIMMATDEGTVDKISDLVKNRKLKTATIMEEISIGISHAQIGHLLAEKWGFPPIVVEIIRWHHNPLAAPEFSMKVVKIVYLANIMCGIEDRRYNFTYIEEDILSEFGLIDEAKFKALHNKLKERYSLK